MDGDLSQMIQKIMQNPEFSNMVNELRGEMSGDKQGDDAQNTQKSNDDITAEMMSKLPDVMAMVSPLLGKSDGDHAKSDGNPHDSKSQDSKSANNLPKKYDKAKAEKLLYAIKPYLSQTRCEMIDKCVSVMQLGDVMGSLGGLDGLLGSGKKNHGGEGGT